MGVSHFFLAINDCRDKQLECLLASFGDWLTIKVCEKVREKVREI